MSESIESGKAVGMVQPFVYHPAGHAHGSGGRIAVPSQLWHGNGESARGACEQEELQERERQAHERGVLEGKNQVSHEFEEALAREREAVSVALRDFARQRDSYFRDVETEVLQLTMAIARRILNREAQIDRLALAGVIRVALEKVATSSSLKLHIHPARIVEWQEFFNQQPDLPAVPELVADSSVAQDQCVLETAMGTTDLSLQIQLKEIEQGFLDLLDRRPASR